MNPESSQRLSATEVHGSLDPEVYEGSELHELTHIFDTEVQMVVVPFSRSPFAAWSPEKCWGQSRRDGRFAVRTPDGTANRDDLRDGFELHEGLGQLLLELSEVHATLFGAEEVGLRWVWTDRPTCPRFHEDRLVVRGIYNHCGPTTEWIPSRFVNRSRLGHLSEGMADEVSGLLLDSSQVRRLPEGSLSLFKGREWDGSPRRPLVHRSPPKSSRFRFAITIDTLAMD